jgi:hypothetical protein
VFREEQANVLQTRPIETIECGRSQEKLEIANTYAKSDTRSHIFQAILDACGRFFSWLILETGQLIRILDVALRKSTVSVNRAKMEVLK